MSRLLSRGKEEARNSEIEFRKALNDTEGSW